MIVAAAALRLRHLALQPARFTARAAACPVAPSPSPIPALNPSPIPALDPSPAPAPAPAPVPTHAPVPALAPGVVHAWVGQILLNCNVFKR